jgi:hypothetical protein
MLGRNFLGDRTIGWGDRCANPGNGSRLQWCQGDDYIVARIEFQYCLSQSNTPSAPCAHRESRCKQEYQGAERPG